MDINKLQFRDKNPRKISDENLKKLKKSIKDDETFLTKRKILINHIDWKYIVYCWNQRVGALKELWYKEIPDEWIDIDENLSKELMEKRAFKDNVEYWEWDYDILNDFDINVLSSDNFYLSKKYIKCLSEITSNDKNLPIHPDTERQSERFWKAYRK